jgi:hypothetical protein
MVAFPIESVNLHIFEARYKQLVKDCMENNRSFGLAPFIQEEVKPIGTLMKVKRIEQEYEDGRLDIATEAQGLYKMSRYENPMRDRLYAGADVKPYPINREGDPALSREIREKMNTIFESLQIKKRLPAPELLLSFHIGHSIGFSLEEEYNLLSIKEEYDRQIQVLQQIDKITPKIKTAAQVRNRALLNGEFRTYNSPTDF